MHNLATKTAIANKTAPTKSEQNSVSKEEERELNLSEKSE
jgi:hypothetical protein